MQEQPQAEGFSLKGQNATTNEGWVTTPPLLHHAVPNPVWDKEPGIGHAEEQKSSGPGMSSMTQL